LRYFGGSLWLTWFLGALLLPAAPIVVYNTGVDSGNVVLPDGATDPHYTLVTSPGPFFPGPDAVVVNSDSYPIPPWLANGTDSKWIAPQRDQTGGNTAGLYIYRTTFSLAGLNPATAILTGQWLSDNDGSIWLNGTAVTTGVSGETPTSGFLAFTPFTLDSTNAAFVSGLNTLEFLVRNEGITSNPTGIRVEITGTADVIGTSDVPEPATYILVGLAMTCGAWAWRRQKAIHSPGRFF